MLISKANCQAVNSSKKQTNAFVFTTKRRVFVRFLEEIEHSKKAFPNYLTFTQACRSGSANSEILADQLTLSLTTRGQIMAIKLQLAPPDFQTFLQPCYISTYLVEQFGPVREEQSQHFLYHH